MYQSTEAIILKRRRFSETSLLVSMFTRDFGRVEALAKGARRKSSPMKGHFDLFSLEEVVIFRRERSGLDLAVEASLIREHASIRNSTLDFAAAGIVAEMLSTANMVRDPHPGAYNGAICALNDIDLKIRGNVGLIFGICEILRDYGFMPRLDKCIKCSEQRPKYPRLSGKYGSVVCAQCSDSGNDLTPGELAVLRHINHQGRNISLNNCKDGGINIIRALGGYTRHVLEKPMQSYNVFFELAARSRNRVTQGSR